MKTPKEKANELIEVFASFDDNFNSFRYDVKCAIVCADEMIKITAPECDKYEEYYFQLENSKKQEYWNEVKKELESL